MTLNEFVETFDVENTIVLLEGKRNVLDADKEKLIALGELLAAKTKNCVFRSGNAKGADAYFSEGVTRVNPAKLHVIAPYTGHRKASGTSYETISLDDISIASEDEVLYQSKFNKGTSHLIDQFVAGDRNQYAIKAAYIIRDTIKVIGTEKVSPTTVAIFYDDLKNPRKGGTGHTMNICAHNKIPMMDQRIWFRWLEV